MSDLRINLSRYPERFKEDSRELIISNNVNFIFGKNGTGKTTITKEIIDNFSELYNINTFSGFDGVVGENYRLDAVALGTENAEIQKEINLITSKIKEISNRVERPEDKRENLLTTYEKSIKDTSHQEREIERFFTSSAREIKNKQYDNINIAVTSYNKEKFKNEINSAKLLAESDIEEKKQTIKAEEKKITDKIVFPEINIAEYLKKTNEILGKFVSNHQIINELDNNADKQNFAKVGMRIHKRDSIEKCAFCGNVIDEERWKLLGNYFNDEVKKFEGVINQHSALLNEKLAIISNFQEIDETQFYPNYRNGIIELNSKIRKLKEEYKKVLNLLIENTNEKTKNLFSEDSSLSYDLPGNFSDIEKLYKEFVIENNNFADQLSHEQEKAKTELRLYEIKKLLDDFNYSEQTIKFNQLQEKEKKAKEVLDADLSLLKSQKEKVDELLAKTKDERIIADHISKKLKNMGVSSFSLELVVDDERNQKGQYKIKGHNGEIRHITELSMGEKNIIAFLYFILSLDEVRSNDKPNIVILDDPMNSNDDTMQYLMIGEIQKYYRKIFNNDYFIVLTHNCHFYLNIRPNTSQKFKENGEEISFYKKFGNYHFHSDGKQTTIKKIIKGKKDFKTNYEMLWIEFQFLYSVDEPNLMLNVCRKICETYMSFTKKSLERFYGDNTNAKKLFDVNQHSIDDMDAEQNGRTREEIRDILKLLFEQNSAEEHFDSYFKIA